MPPLKKKVNSRRKKARIESPAQHVREVSQLTLQSPHCRPSHTHNLFYKYKAPRYFLFKNLEDPKQHAHPVLFSLIQALPNLFVCCCTHLAFFTTINQINSIHDLTKRKKEKKNTKHTNKIQKNSNCLFKISPL